MLKAYGRQKILTECQALFSQKKKKKKKKKCFRISLAAVVMGALGLNMNNFTQF